MTILNVHIGEVKIARKGEVLKAILGSCVGIGFIWRSQNICGLAHCLLPENPDKSFSISGRYVDQAIASLLAMMKIKENDKAHIEVIFAGGGNMTQPHAEDNSALVGGLNLKATERELKKHDLRVVFSDYGGSEGRKIIIDSSSCTFEIEKIPRMIA